MSILFYLYNLTREKKFDEIIEKYSIDKFLFLDILFQEVLIIKYFMFFLLNKNLQGIKFIIFLIYSIINGNFLHRKFFIIFKSFKSKSSFSSEDF